MSRLKLWLKNMMVLNPGLKLLALMMAVFTFHAIRGETNDEAVHFVPVEVRPADPNRLVVDQHPLSVSLTLRGSRDDLKKMDAQEIKVVLKLRGREDGPVPIRRRDIRGIAGMRLAKIEPDRVTVATAAAQDKPAAKGESAPRERAEAVAWRQTPVAILGPDGSPDDDSHADPDMVDIVVTGPPDTRESLSPEPPFVYVYALEPDEPYPVRRKIRLRRDFPPEVDVAVHPPSVTLFRHEEGER